MSIAPSTDDLATEPKGIRNNFERLCTKFDANPSLLDDPDHAVTLRAWLKGMSTHFPMPGIPATDLYAAYAGSVDPVLRNTSEESLAEVFTFPAGETQEAPVLPSSPVNDKWVRQFVPVHADVFRRHRPEWAERITIMRRLIDTTTRDALVNPEWLATVLSTDPAKPLQIKTLRGWFKAGRFGEDVIHTATKWHEDEDGVLREMWRLEFRPINLVPKVDENGRPMLDKRGKQQKTWATEADRFVRVFFNWMWENPTTTGGDRWVRREGVTPGAVWFAAVLHAQAAGKPGVKASMRELANWWRLSEARLWEHSKAAEAAGLYTTSGSRSGRRSAYRKPRTVATAETTSATRAGERGGNRRTIETPEMRNERVASSNEGVASSNERVAS